MNRREVKHLLHDYDAFRGRAGIAKTLQRLSIAGFIVIYGIQTSSWQAIAAYIIAALYTFGILSKLLTLMILAGFIYLSVQSLEIMWLVASICTLSYLLIPKK